MVAEADKVDLFIFISIFCHILERQSDREGRTHTEREIFSPLICSPDVHNNLSWVRLKPGVGT